MMILIIAFDQITKFFAQKYLSDGSSKHFIKGIVDFRYAENTGMAFSLFSGARWVFIAITLIVCIAAMWYLFSNKCKSLWPYWSIGVIVAGGFGNLIDRAFNGLVIDFIEPTFMNFAIFNIADCAVTLGAVSLVLYLVKDSLKKEKKDE